MTTDGSEYLIRCFAYSKDGQRCEQLAGHDGNHAVVKEWTDDEVWDPSMALIPPTVVHLGKTEITQHYTAPPTGDDDSSECLICDHSMHRGMCNVDACDCRNGVPN